MSLRALLGPAVAALLATGIALVFFDQARLPDLFPWSRVVLPACLTFLLALGLSHVLPGRLYHTKAERLLSDLATSTGLTGTASARVLEHVSEAQMQAARLRMASAEMREDVADQTRAAAQDLEALAERLMAEPGQATAATTMIARAGLVVEAVENFVAYKAEAGATPDGIDAARMRIADSLATMSDAADAVQTRLSRQRLVELEVATEVADGLFKRGK